MEINKQTKVQASIDDIWAMIDDPAKFAAAAETDVKIEQKGDAQYEVKIPIKLGILTLNANCKLDFVERSRPDVCRAQFNASVPGGGVEGDCELRFKPESDAVTIVDIKANVSAKGVVQHMLGGADSKDSKLESLIDRIVSTAGQANDKK